MELKETRPVIKVVSKYFAGKQINVERGLTAHFGDAPAGTSIFFGKDGFAEINPEQLALIEANTSYSPFVTAVDAYDKEYKHEVPDEAVDEKPAAKKKTAARKPAEEVE